MKYTIIIFVFILTLSCQNKEINIFNGTWNKCHRNGEYTEWVIEQDRVFILGILKDDIAVFEYKIDNNSLIIKGLNVSLPYEIDTLVLISKTKKRIILEGGLGNQIIELNKIENGIVKIDSTNLEKWKSQTILNFQKRAEFYNCPDLRTEDEKIIPDLGNINPVEEMEIEIPLDNVKDSSN